MAYVWNCASSVRPGLQQTPDYKLQLYLIESSCLNMSKIVLFKLVIAWDLGNK